MPPHIQDANTINKWLVEHHHKSLDGRPIWRVTWPNGITEKRVGEWEDWYGSVFVRRSFGLQEVIKYPLYQSRWVLERLTFLPMHSPVRKELVDTENGTYEPVYVFWRADGSYLPPKLEVVQKILHDLLHPVILTPGDINRSEKELYNKELEATKDILRDAGRASLFVGMNEREYGGWDGRPRKGNDASNIILTK